MYNVGRNNPRVRAALVEALELETPGKSRSASRRCRRSWRRRLLAAAPPGLGQGLFTSSGTEAVEAAIKLGRAATGRARVVSREHGFHGLTLGSLSVDGTALHRRFDPLLPGVALCRSATSRRSSASCGGEDVAVFIVEPVQGKGVNLPPPATSRGAQELCRRYGTLFCVDEVQTGFGRTGRLFASEHWGLEPDLMPVAKSLSGGYVPVGALLLRAAVFEAVFDSLETRRATARRSRRTTWRWSPASRRCTSSTRRASSSGRPGWASCCSSGRGRSSSATRS